MTPYLIRSVSKDIDGSLSLSLSLSLSSWPLNMLGVIHLSNADYV
jgi:hypothetical protein